LTRCKPKWVKKPSQGVIANDDTETSGRKKKRSTLVRPTRITTRECWEHDIGCGTKVCGLHELQRMCTKSGPRPWEIKKIPKGRGGGATHQRRRGKPRV